MGRPGFEEMKPYAGCKQRYFKMDCYGTARVRRNVNMVSPSLLDAGRLAGDLRCNEDPSLRCQSR